MMESEIGGWGWGSEELDQADGRLLGRRRFPLLCCIVDRVSERGGEGKGRGEGLMIEAAAGEPDEEKDQDVGLRRRLRRTWRRPLDGGIVEGGRGPGGEEEVGGGWS
jgi:hypothetical protein